jgi:hypothetical protein
MQHVASRWASLLGSPVTIHVDVRFNQNLDCSEADGAVLAAASAAFVFEDFADAPVANTWYPGALAEALSGTNLSLEDDTNPNAGDIRIEANPHIDEGCLGPGTRFYYGLNNNLPANQISFVNVLLHEMAHGLGFFDLLCSPGVPICSSLPAGAWIPLGGMPQPDIYSRSFFDNDQGRHWHQMTNAQRAASSVNSGRVGFDGSRTTAQAPNFLEPGPSLLIHSPASIAGNYPIGTAAFGPPLTVQGITGDVQYARDGIVGNDGTSVGTVNDGCEPLVGFTPGRVALIDRGFCNFTVKVKNAQNAGAIGVIIANNVSGPPPGMSGDDPTIVIPAVSVSIQDGQRIKTALATPEPAATLRFSSSSYAVSESAGTATITVTRSGTTNTAVGVAYSTSNGTATAGQDYTSVAGTLSFAAGETSKTFAVTVLEDMLEEDTETVLLTLSAPSGQAVLGSPSTATLNIGDNEPCVADVRTLCLNGGRFRVRVDWRNFENETGFGSVVQFGADDSGLMWFFDADNWEMLIKILNGCGFNNHYWVFSAATTNVEYRMTVTDTLTGEIRDDYFNPLGTAADATTDIEAFATCP